MTATDAEAQGALSPQAEVDALLDRLESLVAAAEALEPGARDTVFELVDGLDRLHRSALRRLAEAVGPERLAAASSAEPAVAWLCAAYGLEADEVAAAAAALDAVRPYVESHGGSIEVLGAGGGRVRVRLAGSCSGCTGSAATLRNGVEEALRAGLAGFVALEVEEDTGATAHPPPVETPVELVRKRA